jgi:hypothetical protein
MGEWPESALEPNDDDEAVTPAPDKIEDAPAAAKAGATESPSMPRLRHLGVVASGSEIVRPPQNADYPPGSLRLGLIGRAAMNKRVSIEVLMELIDNKSARKRRKRHESKTGRYLRGHGL